jgi:lipopolysaccharide transport system permease protein
MINKQMQEIDQILSLTKANMRARYRKTYAGFLWVVLNPLLMFGVQSLVFKVFLKLEVENYFIFLLSGLLPWIFITSSFNMCAPILQNSAKVLKAFEMNPFVIVHSQIIDNLINFLAAFFLVFIPLSLVSTANYTGIIFLPLALIPLYLGVIGACRFLAISQVFYRDTKFVIPFMTSILFFLTPIFYPPEFVPEHLRWAVDFNPIYIMIEPFRICIYDFSVILFFKKFIIGTIFAGAIYLISKWFWRVKRNEFYLFL